MSEKGNLHPITNYIREMVKVFESLGFDVFEGPEVDNEWYNFDALNMPKTHPARDMQDTFFLTDGRLLRTQTSNCQVRYAENKKPPIRVVVPGICYRNESTDARHETTFMQIEGLCIDKGINIGHLFWTLETFFKKFLGPETGIRFRPSYFPFTEPSFEFEVQFGGKWFELGGAGMVHPKVLTNMNINPDEYSGFAFGPGIERPIMVKYGIENVRLFRAGDLRFLKQF